MNKKITAFALSTMILFSGCSSLSYSASGEISVNERGKVATKGVVKIEKKVGSQLIKPLLQAVASYTSFSYEDFLAFDPSELKMQISETNSVTTVENNKIKFSVYSSGTLYSSKEFSVKKSGGYYVLTDPAAVKNWAQDFVDIVDSIEYTFGLNTNTSSATNVSVVAFNGNSMITANSYRYVCGGGNSQVTVCDPSGPQN